MSDPNASPVSREGPPPGPDPRVARAQRLEGARRELIAATQRGEGGRNALRQYSHRMDALVQQLFAEAGPLARLRSPVGTNRRYAADVDSHMNDRILQQVMADHAPPDDDFFMRS
jgi:hypothetical protein